MKTINKLTLILTALGSLTIVNYVLASDDPYSKASKTTQPDIGATVKALEVRYGKLDKIEPAWCGGTAYGFMASKANYVYAIVAPGETTVSDIMYVKTKGHGDYGVGLWDKNHRDEMQALFDQNKSNSTWTIHTVYLNNWVMWYHSKVFGKAYWLEYEAFGRKNLTANLFNQDEIGPEYKTGWHGFQVRTLAQFKREEKFVKQLQLAAKGQGKVGAL